MTSPIEGKLIWKDASGDAELLYLNPDHNQNTRLVAPDKISNDIVPSAAGQNVEFTLVEVARPGQRPRRQITRVTVPGRPFVQRPTIAALVPPEDDFQGFINPYNFVPTVKRDTGTSNLGDSRPAGHHQLLPDLYSGWITVKMIVKTPLLVPDACVTIDENDHKTFDIRTNNAGQVLIPPTSVKGMLRSAYETVTNSRFSIFQHTEPLTYRSYPQPQPPHRKPHPNSPQELLDEEFHPASKIDDLSPADRVFGWTRSKTRGVDSGESHDSYAGQISIGPIVPVPGEVKIQSGTTLAILSGPKPQQTRFYLGQKNKEGAIEPLPNSKNKILYSIKQNPRAWLRGRKIYPHHRNRPDDYWKKEDAEYCCKEKGDQNQTMQRWVGLDSQFTFTLSLRNLSSFELGALIYLLKLPKGRFHRLGGAKPLGFGSVRLKLVEENSSLATGSEWVNILENLGDPVKVDPERIQNLLECFNGLVIPEALNRQAFERSAEGFDSPIHYPRPYPERGAEENEGFNWFKKNENITNQFSLPDILIKEPKLPYFPAENN